MIIISAAEVSGQDAMMAFEDTLEWATVLTRRGTTGKLLVFPQFLEVPAKNWD
jgi:hypothetical protein